MSSLLRRLAARSAFVAHLALAGTVAASLVPATAQAAETEQVGREATPFSLRDVDGKTVKLEDLKGKVVVLSFWATWCGPCKEEMPHLEQMYAAHKDEGLVVLSISSDDARTASRVKPYIRSKGFTFPVLLDTSSKVTGVYNPMKTLPWTVVIGRDFTVAKVHSGYNPGDEKELEALVGKLLAATAE